jgi:4-amino-4-deoxy-L-arabinose transferase-like glycosyltransferase
VEQVIKASASWQRLGKGQRDILLTLLFLVAATAFLFIDVRTVPIILWDESRNAVNALEMRATGWSLITTYDFQPDHWNTKPPLLIWLMTLSMSVFGPTEWAIRLPVALAALGTLLCLILFVRKVTGSTATGILAATLLLLSPGFFGEHGARTGDYDVPLLFFVTAGLQLLFLAIHRGGPNTRLMAAVGACVALGAMTKTIAVFIPFTGVLIYLIATGRFLRTLMRWQGILLGGAIAIAPLLAFYAVRNAIDPGHLDAVFYNDMGGRFMEPITGEPSTPAYYIAELLRGWFFAGPLLLSVLLAVRLVQGRARLLLLWSLYVACGGLLVFSISSTRLIHYALPVFPWLAIAVAVALRALGKHYLVEPWREGKKAAPAVAAIALTLLTAQLTARATDWRYEGFPERQFPPQSAYGDTFRHMAERGITNVIVVDAGFEGGNKRYYVPLLRAYELIWREKGFAIEHRITMPTHFDRPVVSCEPNTREVWARPDVRWVGPCAVIDPVDRTGSGKATT